MLTVSGLYKRWGPVQALDGFDLHIEPGEICGLIGHNGAGKTTFARTVAGLERPDAGSVLVAGVDLATAPRSARSLIGLAPQESALYPTATLRQNLRLFGGLAGLHRTRLSTELAAVAEELVLTDVLDRPIATLSGGQQRRAQAATVLLPRPRVLLLDEPTVGADPTTREALLRLVRTRADEGAAVCYTTHYLPELEHLDATLAVAASGRVIARGHRADLLDGLPGEVTVTFTGAVPEHLARTSTAPGELRFSTADPAQALARLLRDLGPDTARVRSAAIREPSLDDLYRSLATRQLPTETHDAA
ncbi:ABC transporter ATP-binding protein [Streptomyces sp. NBC_01478]|uniref:ABC transporter ATP-binding protein n=1 Tax=Streptomyces sp. NBC_01478 TaxID=2903882 RepID=UPI002E300DCA|nr:ABC transporter ATP-binding protein [Streptomyces sp. NBC_01478]